MKTVRGQMDKEKRIFWGMHTEINLRCSNVLLLGTMHGLYFSMTNLVNIIKDVVNEEE